MHTHKIGSLEVSVIGLGGNNFGTRISEERSLEVIDAALNSGINLIVTAEVYGAGQSEEIVGKAIKGRRDGVVVATKFGLPVGDNPAGAKPATVRASLTRSLSRLQTDWIDLYSLHRPDPETPIEETLGVLEELQREGLVREVGCSNFTAALLQDAIDASTKVGRRFVCVENEFNVLKRGDELDVMPLCQKEAIGYIPYWPLASGLLTGKYDSGSTLPSGTRIANYPQEMRDYFLSETNLDRVKALDAIAIQANLTLLELAMSWLMTRPAITSVIAGSSSVDQLKSNISAASVTLDPAVLEEIDRVSPIE